MMCSKARSSVREPGRVPAGFGSGLPFGFRSLSDTAPSLPALLGASAEVVPSAATSATRYERSERIGLALHVVAELEFVDVKRHVGFRHLVIGADDAALEQAPEAFNRVGMDNAANIFAFRMADDGVRELVFDVAVAGPFIGHDQIDLIGNRLLHEPGQNFCANAVNHASDDLALARDRANDRHLTGTNTAASAATAPAVLVVGLTADEGFIDLDNTEQLALGAVAH